MARSFSASEVFQIVCGDDNDEEIIFPGSDADLGMNDTDDDDLEGDSDSDEPSEMYKTGTGNLSGGNEPGGQEDALPVPSAWCRLANPLEQAAISSVDGASISSSAAASEAIAASAATLTQSC